MIAISLALLTMGATCYGRTLPRCNGQDAPSLILRVSDNVFPPPNRETPILVEGRACPGTSITLSRLREEYEIRIYAFTNAYYIQPFADARSRHRIRKRGFFRTYSHDANLIVALLVRRGCREWPAQQVEPFEVDGDCIVAIKEVCVGLQCACDETEPSNGDASGECTNSDFVGEVEKLLSALDGKWINYAPRNYNPVEGVYPTCEQIAADLDQLCNVEGYKAVLTYTFEGTLGHIPCIAKEVGCDIVGAGIYDINSPAEIARARRARDCVAFYIVGSEGIFVEPQRYTREELQEALRRVRALTCRPVTTAEPWQTWLEKLDPQAAEELAAALDFASANIYGWWQGEHEPCPAADETERLYEQVRQLVGEAPLIIRETGWPTAGHPDASVAGQQEYFACLAEKNLPFVHFEAYDQPWKEECCCEPGECHNIGPHWGLHDTNGNLKAE